MIRNLRAEILKEHSKENTGRIVQWIGSDPQRFARLLDLFRSDEYRVVQRAAWAVSNVAEQHPELIRPHLATIVAQMSAPDAAVAVKRNVTRLLQMLPIPEPLHAAVMNQCFLFLADPKETVAVRCFSMGILANLAEIYPDIRHELISLLKTALEHEKVTPGFRSKARRVLEKIR